METYLPIMKTILSDWFQLTLNNPLYAAVLATVVWLLTAIIYSIKIASLKKKNIASEKARIEMQNKLNTAQQQMQKMQEELTANAEQMKKDQQLAQNEAQRAAGLEEQLSQRNKQIAGIIQTLATSFDLGERPLPVTEDIKAEGLWQQHERVVTLLTTRLCSEQQAKIELQQSYQAEMLKRAEKEALIESLQTTLASQTSLFSKLEQGLEEQKSILLQQQDNAHQVLAQALEKHLSELARLTELDQQALELVNTRQKLTQFEEKLNAKDALITQLEKNKPDDQVKVQAQPAFIKRDEKETTIELKTTDEEVPPAPLVIKQQPVSSAKEQTGGVTGKLKGLFGKTKQESITAEKEPFETKPDEPEIRPASVDVKQTPVSPLKDRYGKTKYYFGDMKPQPEDTKQEEAKTQPAALDDQQLSMSAAKGQFGKLKSLFGSKRQPAGIKQNEEEIQPAPVEAKQPSVSPAKGNLGKLKNLFGKTK